LAGQFCTTIGADLVNAALASYVGHFLAALRADTVAAGARAGLVTAATLACSTACATTKAASVSTLALARIAPLAAPASWIGAAFIALLSKSITEELLKHNLS
jgi:threonine/homoserine/homoserine lactone efflux protein